MAELPYLTEQQIRDKYAQQYADYEKQRNAEAERARAQTNSQYDANQRQNYINYMQTQKDLPEQMARMGITGGASETSALRSRTNYENNFSNTERSRGADINKINTTLADTLNTYKMTADANMNDEIAQNAQLRAQYEKQLQQEAEQRFANTISGYDSISGIDAEIAKIQKSGVDLWKIDYLRARRAELAAAEAAAYSGGGGGGYSYSGGGGGYTYTGGGGGGGGSTVADAAAGAAARWKQSFNGKKSSGGGNKTTKSNTTKTSTGRTAYYKNRTSGASYRNSKKSRDYSWRKR